MRCGVHPLTTKIRKVVMRSSLPRDLSEVMQYFYTVVRIQRLDKQHRNTRSVRKLRLCIALYIIFNFRQFRLDYTRRKVRSRTLSRILHIVYSELGIGCYRSGRGMCSRTPQIMRALERRGYVKILEVRRPASPTTSYVVSEGVLG